VFENQPNPTKSPPYKQITILIWPKLWNCGDLDRNRTPYRVECSTISNATSFLIYLFILILFLMQQLSGFLSIELFKVTEEFIATTQRKAQPSYIFQNGT